MNLPLQWPAELSAQAFLDHYWQRRSLLFRQAFAGFKTPISADELAGLSLEEDVNPRLIFNSGNGQYHAESGPFDESRFASLTDNNWSLLVTDVEKHLPELRSYLKPFAFLPHWRIDDLMISYAPNGASVGAHVDEYDVFLLQASGTRRWAIDTSANPDLKTNPDSDLKILKNFSPNETYELAPGDMLYLPPGMPHHGVACSDNCTTWSIGFRAPSQIDILTEFSDLLANTLEERRYRDPPLHIAQTGEIDNNSLQAIKQLWLEATSLNNDQLTMLSGSLLTMPQTIDIERYNENKDPNTSRHWMRHPFSRFAYIGSQKTVDLFVDAQVYRCSKDFAITLCSKDSIDSTSVVKDDLHTLNTLITEGCMLPIEPD